MKSVTFKRTAISTLIILLLVILFTLTRNVVKMNRESNKLQLSEIKMKCKVVKVGSAWVYPNLGGVENYDTCLAQYSQGDLTAEKISSLPGIEFLPVVVGDSIYFLNHNNDRYSIVRKELGESEEVIYRTKKQLRGFVISPDHEKIVCIYHHRLDYDIQNRTVVLDANSGKRLSEVKVGMSWPLCSDEDGYYSAEWTMNDSTVISHTDYKSNEVENIFETPGDLFVHGYSPSAKVLVCVSDDSDYTTSAIQVIDIETGGVKTIYTSPLPSVFYLSVNQDNEIICVVGDHTKGPADILRLTLEGDLLEQLSWEELQKHPLE
jgi:hypothetical protein